jgi:hypothetical protein
MLATPTYPVALATLNGPVAGPIFATAVIVIGVGATVAYTVSVPSTAGPPPNQLERTLAAELAFGLWSVLGCLAVLLATRAASSAAYSISMDGQITEPRSVPEPAGVVFAVTCLARAAPFIIAWQRRRAWLAVAAVAAATAAAGTAHLFANPPDDFYTPKPPVALLLAIVAVGVVAAIFYADAPSKPSRLAPGTQAVIAQAFFVAWALISLVGMTIGLGLANDVQEGAQEPGGAIFAVACLLWTLPYVAVARRRRSTLWIVIACVSIAIAVFGIVYLFRNPTPCGCD